MIASCSPCPLPRPTAPYVTLPSGTGTQTLSQIRHVDGFRWSGPRLDAVQPSIGLYARSNQRKDYNRLNEALISKIEICSKGACAMDPDSLIHEPELDMNRSFCRQTLAEKVLRTLASALESVAFRWFGRRRSLLVEHPCRSADRERQHFIEPWEEDPRR